MDSLTLVAIALAVLAVAVTVIVLRRRGQDSSYGRIPLSLDDNTFPAPVLTNSTDSSSQSRLASKPPSARAVPDAAEMAEVYSLVQRGNKIGAIKRYRELTGLGLKEAKDYVEAMPNAGPLPTLAPQPAVSASMATPDLAEVSALLAGGNKIAAIKRLRELTGLGLKEAKDYVEAMPSSGTLPAPPSSSAQPAGAGDLAEVHVLAQQGHKIEAIKRYRELTGVGLKEAKDYVDRL